MAVDCLNSGEELNQKSIGSGSSSPKGSRAIAPGDRAGVLAAGPGAAGAGDARAGVAVRMGVPARIGAGPRGAVGTPMGLGGLTGAGPRTGPEARGAPGVGGALPAAAEGRRLTGRTRGPPEAPGGGGGGGGGADPGCGNTGGGCPIAGFRNGPGNRRETPMTRIPRPGPWSQKTGP